MNGFPLPPDATPTQARIIEVYAEVRNVTKTAKRLHYKDSRFVRRVIASYFKYRVNTPSIPY